MSCFFNHSLYQPLSHCRPIYQPTAFDYFTMEGWHIGRINNSYQARRADKMASGLPNNEKLIVVLIYTRFSKCIYKFRFLVFHLHVVYHVRYTGEVLWIFECSVRSRKIILSDCQGNCHCKFGAGREPVLIKFCEQIKQWKLSRWDQELRM